MGKLVVTDSKSADDRRRSDPSPPTAGRAPDTDTGARSPVPNMPDYEASVREFSWAAARADLGILPAGGLNIAFEALDRPISLGLGDRDAVRFVRRDGAVHRLTYIEMRDAAAALASALRMLGMAPGDRVFTLLGRCPELFATVLGTLRAGGVVCPLFPAFGPDPVRERLRLGNGRILVTTEALYRRKVADRRHELPDLEHVLIVGPPAPDLPDVLSYDAIVGAAPVHDEPAATGPDDMALLHFTSGTTGSPKGAVHVHEAVVAHHSTGMQALDLHPGDVYWCTADPGWVTGMSYGIIAPLTCGATLVVDEAEFDLRRWYRILTDQRVNVWYTAPTAIRMLMRAAPRGAADVLPPGTDLSALRFTASVGEPLNPEAVLWGRDVLGLPFHDTWWQTETGSIMIANFASGEVRPGSMGRPVPGIAAAVLARGADGRARVEDGRVAVLGTPGVDGELALRIGWPSMFRGYLHEDERYAKCFADGWYLTGDLARRDEDGWFWFVGRADDVIKSAGHLVGPFEVESALLEHPAVAESGVVGRPDAVAGEIVKAFVTLRPGYRPTDELRRELLAFTRTRLGPAVAPREIAFDQDLPKTNSGKVVRRLLRAREQGLPAGDVSSVARP